MPELKGSKTEANLWEAFAENLKLSTNTLSMPHKRKRRL